jgi:hypothetical protein
MDYSHAHIQILSQLIAKVCLLSGELSFISGKIGNYGSKLQSLKPKFPGDEGLENPLAFQKAWREVTMTVL